MVEQESILELSIKKKEYFISQKKKGKSLFWSEGKKEKMNPNQNQQSSEGTHDNDAALAEFLASLMDYTPTVIIFSSIPFPSDSQSNYNYNYDFFSVFFFSDTRRACGALLSQQRPSMS